MSKQVRHILTLAALMQSHLMVTHWAISKRISTKSDYLHRLQNGGDTATRIAEEKIERFSQIWPEDLEWPADIPRPEKETASVSGERKAS